MSDFDFPDDLHSSNQLRTYYELDRNTYAQLRAGNDEFAISTARTLLEDAELPLLLRVRSCLVLACSDEPDYLDMANEAVRIAEIANSVARAGEGESKLLQDCKSIQSQAQADFDEEEE